jgi:hypothetical protein
LTPEQIHTLSQAAALYHRAVQQGQDGPEHAFAKTALNTLTPDQQDRWRVMLGKPLSVKTAAKPTAPTAVRQ